MNQKPTMISVLTKANVYGEVKLYDEFGNTISNERMTITMLQFEGVLLISILDRKREGWQLFGAECPLAFNNLFYPYMKTKDEMWHL